MISLEVGCRLLRVVKGGRTLVDPADGFLEGVSRYRGFEVIVLKTMSISFEIEIP